MKNLFTLTLCFLTLSLTAQETITYPYNPDANGDTLIGISDVLETISIYGSEFLPSDIMVGDTSLYNWIQLLNQTLINQQAIIDILQADLESQETQLDSTMIANMISAAGGFGSGGGCNWQFPEGLDGEAVTFNPIESSYIVPENKRLYIIQNGTPNGTHDVFINGTFIELDHVNSNPLILDQNDEIYVPPNSGGSGFMNGILVDAENTLEPIWLLESFQQGYGVYQVPEGKILVVLYTDDIENLILNGFNTHLSGNAYLPFFIPELTNINSSTFNGRLHGYLVDEDYFADCGGGESNEGGLLNTEFGDTEHHRFFELEWEQQINGSGYFTPLQFENDGIFRITGGNSTINLIVVPDSIPEEQFSNDNLAEANFFDTYWQGDNPEITMPLNSDEQLVLYGNTGVVEEGTTIGNINLFWTPLQTQINEGVVVGSGDQTSISYVEFSMEITTVVLEFEDLTDMIVCSSIESIIGNTYINLELPFVNVPDGYSIKILNDGINGSNGVLLSPIMGNDGQVKNGYLGNWTFYNGNWYTIYEPD